MKNIIQVVHTESGEIAKEIYVSNTTDPTIEGMRRRMESQISDGYHVCVVRFTSSTPHNQQQGE